MTIKLETQAEGPHGLSDATRRTVRENCGVLKFDLVEFEEE